MKSSLKDGNLCVVYLNPGVRISLLLKSFKCDKEKRNVCKGKHYFYSTAFLKFFFDTGGFSRFS